RLFRWRSKRRTICVAGGDRSVAVDPQELVKRRANHVECCRSLKSTRCSHTRSANPCVHGEPHSVSRWTAYCCAGVTRDSNVVRRAYPWLGNRKRSSNRQAAAVATALL